MSKSVVIALAIVLVIGGILLYRQSKQGEYAAPNGTSTGENSGYQSGASAKGNVVISVTDAAADMKNITSIQMTVSKVEAHSDGQGWVTLSNDAKQFDLLALKSKGELALAASASVTADTYNQIRLQVDKVVVVQSGVSKEAKLPSGELKIDESVRVEGSATSSVKLDFIADKSLHVTGTGEFIFAPVVKAESRSRADVAIAADGKVKVSGGTVEASLSFGMDADGTVKNNFILNTAGGVEINGGIIKLKARY